MGPGQPGRHPRVHDAGNVRRDQDRSRFARQRSEPDRCRAARRGAGRDRGSRHRAVGERALPRADPRVGECAGRAARRGVEPDEVGQPGLAARGYPADQHALSVTGGRLAGCPGDGSPHCDRLPPGCAVGRGLPTIRRYNRNPRRRPACAGFSFPAR
ncbi:hypothetical protein EMIT0158MI4_50133 [Burkholderia ambifaria]